MTRQAIRRAACAALCVMLSACAALSPVPSGAPSSTAAQAGRPYREAIDIGGRLSLRYQGNSKEEALHGSFAWSQSGGTTTVTLLSPLGQTLAVITAGPSGATLAQSGQPLRSAADVDTLTAETLGWPLPVAGLRDWLQGFAAARDGTNVIATPAAQDIVTRDGWELRYPAWSDAEGGEPPHPRRIDLARRTAQAGDVSIRIVIDTWQPR
ncbi:lipoprotein insertase outer membrane protein LolB [Noviherbaspirillum galbum]|uniref:Outer-membrane lipoprotein LolB n=1 Tax=Noviherbaspirillum galbum TaxID=2709383 RepID=A0A6B3SUE1_9BURK|nr:lipoprotein insertase outer membrane protein LolB [Noviherbaspirillum galbum]NEX64337.1 outer membrane lipoprotein LolB [Noviherbaspirillum galbum]